MEGEVKEILPLSQFLLVVLLPGVVGTIFFGILGFDVWLKVKTKGATLIKWWDSNREENSELLKLGSNRSFVIGDPNDPNSPTFIIDTQKQHFSFWPPGFPVFLQQRVTTYYYRDDQSEPIDPTGVQLARVISPQGLTSMTNEAMLKVSLAEARENAEGGLLPFRKLPTLIFYGVLVTGVAAIASAVLSFMNYQSQTDLLEIMRGFGG